MVLMASAGAMAESGWPDARRPILSLLGKADSTSGHPNHPRFAVRGLARCCCGRAPAGAHLLRCRTPPQSLKTRILPRRHSTCGPRATTAGQTASRCEPTGAAPRPGGAARHRGPGAQSARSILPHADRRRLRRQQVPGVRPRAGVQQAQGLRVQYLQVGFALILYELMLRRAHCLYGGSLLQPVIGYKMDSKQNYVCAAAGSARPAPPASTASRISLRCAALGGGRTDLCALVCVHLQTPV
jgi:hypothetical protein